MLNQDIIQQEFRYLDNNIYLDTPSMGMPPQRVKTALASYVDCYSANAGRDSGKYFSSILEGARKELSALMHVSPEEITFMKSTADSITTLANSFPFSAGDNVIISTEEHASNLIPWLALENKGVEVRFVQGINGCIEADAVVAKMDSHTRIVCLPTACFCSGYLADTEKIGQACFQRGIVYAVDAIQSVGRIDLDPIRSHIDYIACGGYKGLMGVKGISVTMCSKTLLARLKPFTGSTQSTLPMGRPARCAHYRNIQWKDDACCLADGNYNYSGILSLRESASLINELGIENIQQHVLYLENQLRKGLAELGCQTIDIDCPNRSGIVFIQYPERFAPCDIQSVFDKNHIVAKVRDDHIRVGITFFNTEAHIKHFLLAMQEMVAD